MWHAVVEQVFADRPTAPMLSQRRLADLRRDHAQPDPRRVLGLALPCRTHSATTRADMIDVPPARPCRGHLILHLPQCWHREAE